MFRKIIEKYKKLSKRRKAFVIGEFIIVFLIGFFCCYYICTDIVFVDRTGDPAAKTDTKPAIFATSRNLMQEMGRRGAYQELYKRIDKDEDKYKHMYVIPGLNGTKTLNLHCGEVDLCKDMVPQGLAVGSNFIFFTMYCHKGEHNSVVMVLNKETGEFVKEIPLEGKPHVGGIAYDTANMMLWISGKKNSKATAIGLSLGDIKRYDSETMRGPIRYTHEVELNELPSNSFMTYKDGKLYIGSFNLRGNGKIHLYLIDEHGAIVETEEDLTKLKKVKNFVGFNVANVSEKFAVVLPCIQGISFFDDQLIMTQSFGPFNSTLMLSKDTKIENGNNKLLDRNISGEMNFPPYLEYAFYSEADDRVYFLFEGAAKAYRWRCRMPMDRIVSFPAD